jgi:uncharacterized protein YggE
MLDLSPTKKRYIFAGLTIVAVCGTILISSLLTATRPIYVQNNTGIDGKPVNNISVSATGKVTVKPDLVMVTVGYTTKKDDMVSLQKDLNDKNNAIVKALKAFGIEDKDITTASFDIQPSYRYEYQTGKQINDGQTGSVRLNIKVRNLDKTGEIIDGAVNAGANIVDNITFTVDDLDKPKVEARKLAAQAAKAKAQVLADSSNASLGGLIAISEESQSYPTPVTYNYAKDMTASSSSQTPIISAGSLEIAITVQATYAIK